MSATLLFLIFLIAAILIGWKFNLNVGILGLIFAMILGIYWCDMSVSTIIAKWPISLTMTLVFVTYFFGYSLNNGTMDKIALTICYWGRKIPWALPIIMFLMMCMLATLGISSFALFAFMAPIVILVGTKCKIHPIVLCQINVGGAVASAYSSISTLGATTMNTLSTLGYTGQLANNIRYSMWINAFISEFTVFLILYFIFKAYKCDTSAAEKPEPFTPVQKKNSVVIVCVIVLLFVPVILKSFFPEWTLMSEVAKFTDVMVVTCIGALVCRVLKLGDDKKAWTHVPISTIVLIGGVTTLISVGVDAGAVEAMSKWAGENINNWWAPVILGTAGSALSYVASTTNVCVPTLGALVPGIVANSNFSPHFLLSSLNCSALFSGASPFSSGGSLTLGGLPDQSQRDHVFKWLMILPFLGWGVSSLLAILRIYVTVGGWPM